MHVHESVLSPNTLSKHAFEPIKYMNEYFNKKLLVSLNETGCTQIVFLCFVYSYKTGS